MKIEIKKFKSQRGMEGPGFSRVVWIDGVKTSDAINHGDGGAICWYWFDKDAKAKFDAYVATQPERSHGYGVKGTYKPDVDLVLSDFIDKYEMMRKCKKSTLYRIVGQCEDSYYQLKVAYDENVRTQLEKKYGDKLLEIINETIKN